MRRVDIHEGQIIAHAELGDTYACRQGRRLVRAAREARVNVPSQVRE